MQIKPKSLNRFLIFVGVCTILQLGIRYLFFSHSTPGFYFFRSTKTPHLGNLDLDIDQVKWFRIWYADGNKSNAYGDKYGYYAISGGISKMKKCVIYDKMKIILDSLSSVNYEKVDFSDIDSFVIGELEYISIRFKFKNDPYSKIGEFEVFDCFSGDSLSDYKREQYIMLFHSQNTRYLIDKKIHPEIARLFEELTYKEYDDCMESRMM